MIGINIDIDMSGSYIIIIRLLASAILGGAVGFERETHNRPAGFRTHILVTVGSTLLMLVSMNMGPDADNSRIASQVVSGVGFLGAGTILRTGTNVEGLTTAASIWVCSAIGLAVGNGFYLGAIIVTAIVLIFLRKITSFERLMSRKNYKNITIIGKTRPGFIGEIGTNFGAHNISIINIAIYAIEVKKYLKEEVVFTLKFPKDLDIENLLRDLYKIEGIHEVILNDSMIEKE